jgi:hypothetical protein
MAPKMFGGDIPKAVESFQKSLAIDPAQDETWVCGSAKHYKNKGIRTKQEKPCNALCR